MVGVDAGSLYIVVEVVDDAMDEVVDKVVGKALGDIMKVAMGC